jgi:hypothetical protein
MPLIGTRSLNFNPVESEILMNEKVLKVLNNRADYYPHQLEAKFPHILEKLTIMWDSPEFDTYLNKFMLDKRDHARQGFPPEIATEILRLSMLHSEQFGTKTSHNSWIDSSDIRVE